MSRTGVGLLFVGDDWAEDHHDVELMDAVGRTLVKARLPEGVAGIAWLHAMIGAHFGQGGQGAGEDVAGQVQVGIETDRGPWVQALVAAGYMVFAVNPLQAARYRERLGVSGAKSDSADAHMLADMVRTNAHQLRPVAADSVQAEAVKVVTRTHKTLIWERTRATQRLRHALREYFPAALAALAAFEDLDAADTLELLGRAPDPASAARLSISQISPALKRARRRDIAAKAATIQAVLRAEQLGQPTVVTAAYAAPPAPAPLCSRSAAFTNLSAVASTSHRAGYLRYRPAGAPRVVMALDSQDVWTQGTRACRPRAGDGRRTLAVPAHKPGRRANAELVAQWRVPRPDNTCQHR